MVPGSLAKLTGVRGVTLTRVIGIFEKVDYEKVLAHWKVLEARGAATMQPEW